MFRLNSKSLPIICFHVWLENVFKNGVIISITYDVLGIVILFIFFIRVNAIVENSV